MDIFDFCTNVCMIIAVAFLIEVFILFNIYLWGNLIDGLTNENEENEDEN